MKRKIIGTRCWLVLALLFFAWPPVLALGLDTIPLEGQNLSEAEMAEARGGLSLPGGGVLQFSMDYMRLEYLGNGDPGTSSAFVNTVSQHAVITDEGIQFDMDVLQGFSGSNRGGQGGAGSGQANSILANNSLTGFTGLANTNLIAGNFNVASITNIFNIKVNFFGASDFNPLNSLGLVLH